MEKVKCFSCFEALKTERSQTWKPVLLAHLVSTLQLREFGEGFGQLDTTEKQSHKH